MAMGPDQQRLSPSERANLVAYLDGELNEAESRAIATKLTKSATARREVEVLERTWELLEHLPRPKASDEFTARTLSEVKLIAIAGDQLESNIKHAAKRSMQVASWVLAGFVALGLGFVVTRWVWPNPTARLARDLSIAEHYQEYRDVGSFEFLQELENLPEFSPDRD
jgi:hypothetical protein